MEDNKHNHVNRHLESIHNELEHLRRIAIKHLEKKYKSREKAIAKIKKTTLIYNIVKNMYQHRLIDDEKLLQINDEDGSTG